MVGVLVRDQHAVEPFDLCVQQLLAAVRRHVDEDARMLAVGVVSRDQQAAAAAAVFRIVRIAVAPAERPARPANGRAAAEDGEGQTHAACATGCGIFLNSRKKFSVVCRAMSSNETPRTSARTLAVSTT